MSGAYPPANITDASSAICCMRCSKCFEEDDDAFIARNSDTSVALIFLCYNCIYQNNIQPCQKLNMKSSRNGDSTAAVDSTLLFRYIFQTNSWTDVVSRAHNIREQLSSIDNITNSQLLLERRKRYELEMQLSQSSNDVNPLNQRLSEKDYSLDNSLKKKNVCDALLVDRERDIQKLKEGLEDKERKCNAFEQAYRTIVEQLSSKNMRAAQQQHGDAAGANAAACTSTPPKGVRLYDNIRSGGVAAAEPAYSSSLAFLPHPRPACNAFAKPNSNKRERGGSAQTAEAATSTFSSYNRSGTNGNTSRSAFFESK